MTTFRGSGGAGTGDRYPSVAELEAAIADAQEDADAAAASAAAAAVSAGTASTDAVSASSSATSAAASAASAASDYDSFDDRYLGAKSTAPTLDNDGNTLLVGALYWDIEDALMYAWSGTTWVVVTGGAGALLIANNLSDLANAATARQNLGVKIGTDVQAYDGDLSQIASRTKTKGNLLIGDGTDWQALAVGANDTVLTADSTNANGAVWSPSLDLSVGAPGLSAYQAAVLATSPVGYYPQATALGEDLSTNANHMYASLGEGAQMVGALGRSYTVGGGASYQVAANHANQQDLSMGSAILSVMVSYKAPPTRVAAALVSKGRGPTGAAATGWQLLMSATGAIDILSCHVTTAGRFSVAGVISPGVWVHIIMVIQADSTNVSGVRKAYINGVDTAVSHTSNPAGASNSDSSDLLRIGVNLTGAGALATSFTGSIQHIAIWNREVTSSEAASLYALSGI